MAINKNNGLFDKIKKTIDKDSSKVATSEIFADTSCEELGQASQELIASIELRLLKRFAKEKSQLAEELSAKYMDENSKRSKQQAQKFNLLLQEELENKHKELKLKYEKAAKSLLQKRERELVDKFKGQIKDIQENSNLETAKQISNLQRELVQKQYELEQKDKQMQVSIADAKINARKEQEKSSRALYEELMQSSNAEIVSKLEKKYQEQLLTREHELTAELDASYNESLQYNLAAQKEKLLVTHKQDIFESQAAFNAKIDAMTAEFEAISVRDKESFDAEKRALIAKFEDASAKDKEFFVLEKNAIIAEYTAEAVKYKETYDAKIISEVSTSVSNVTNVLQNSFELERQEFNNVIDKLRAEIENNKESLHIELETKFKNEFDFKYNELKMSLEHDNQLALAAEKQKLSESLQEESLIILKYKEREISEICQHKAQEDQKLALQDALTQQEQMLLDAHQKKTDELVLELQAEYEVRVKFFAAQECARMIERNAVENKTIQNQLQQDLLSQFEEEKSALISEFEFERNTMQAQLEKDKIELTSQFEVEKNLYFQQKNIMQAQFAKDKMELANQFEIEKKLYLEQQRIIQVQLESDKAELLNNFENEKTSFASQMESEKSAFLQQQLNIIRTQFENDKDGVLESQRIILEQQFAKEKKDLLQQIAAQQDELAQKQAVWSQKEASWEIQQGISENSISNEFNHKLEEQQQKLTSAHQLELKDLELRLEQQQQSLTSTHKLEIRELMSMLEQQHQTLTNSHMLELRDLESKLALQEQKLTNTHQIALRSLESKLEQITLAQNSSEADAISVKHVEILNKHEQTLQSQFSDELAQARSAWELQTQNLLIEQAKQLEHRERDLRDEFTKVINSHKESQSQLYNDNKALHAEFAAQLQQQQKDAALELQQVQKDITEQQQRQIGTAIANHTAQIREQYEEELSIISEEQEEKFASMLEQERKKNNLQLMQDKSALIKDLTARFTREKQIEMEQYETDLRDKLYKEMVKQKDYIQHKFQSTQETALNEQKRRLEAEHRHEVERIKQGYFEPGMSRSQQHDQIIAERNVEQLADRILAKFKSQDN